jgi:hypothetical protein
MRITACGIMEQLGDRKLRNEIPKKESWGNNGIAA